MAPAAKEGERRLHTAIGAEDGVGLTGKVKRFDRLGVGRGVTGDGMDTVLISSCIKQHSIYIILQCVVWSRGYSIPCFLHNSVYIILYLQ